MMKRLAIGLVLSLFFACAASFAAFNIYWRTAYPNLRDTDAHLDIPAAGAIAFVTVFVVGVIVTASWGRRARRSRSAGT